MIPGYLPTGPNLSTPGLVFFLRASQTVQAINQIIAVPGTDRYVLQTESTAWYLLDSTGEGERGRTIAPDPNWSTSRILYLSDSGKLVFADSERDLPANVPAQIITYQPSATPKWTARRVRP